MDLFQYQAKKSSDISKPLAEKMRPGNLNEFIGQRHIAAEGKLIFQAIYHDKIFSMILWGPPGCGKTTLARIIAKETQSYFVEFSAVLSGVKEIRTVIEDAKQKLQLYQKKTILFVDEIHRFNKAQQDAFLNHVESGLITLIGATTENPSFEIIAPLISRCRVITLEPLTPDDLAILIEKTLKNKECGLGTMNLDIEKDAFSHIINIADGDARSLLNNLETVATWIISRKKTLGSKESIVISMEDISDALQQKTLRYDKSGEEHYNLISAFHKSLRGSDPDASLYWLARMILAGEDPLYIARRMVRFASEDIGNADPYALEMALSAMEGFRFLGRPEGELALAQAAIYLSTAPKSNSIYDAYEKVKETIKNSGSLPVPMHIRNAPTGLMKSLGYGKDYKYAHDYDDGYVYQDYMPERLKGEHYYSPTDRGFEKTIKQRLEIWSLKKQK